MLPLLQRRHGSACYRLAMSISYRNRQVSCESALPLHHSAGGRPENPSKYLCQRYYLSSSSCPMLVMQAQGLRIRSGLMRRRRLIVLLDGPSRPSPNRSSRHHCPLNLAWRAMAQSLQIDGENIRQAVTELEAHFSQNPSLALCGETFSNFGRNQNFSTE